MLLAAIILKALVEVALIAMIGQGVLYIFAGAGRHQNLMYRLLATVTRPAFKVARFITPRFVLDQHIGFVAFFLLVVLWIVALALKVQAVMTMGAPPA
jgi:hypothetical protein